MAKEKIADKIFEIFQPFLIAESMELWDVEFKKEGRDWFLRVYIDFIQNEGKKERFISTDDCQRASRFLSEKLDEADPIQQQYYLEVSSPGMDRKLIKDEHFQRYIGELVDFKLYRPVENLKKFTAKLIEINEDSYKAELENNKIIEIKKEQLAQARLTIIF